MKNIITILILSTLSTLAATDLRVLNNTGTNITATALYEDTSEATFDLPMGESNLPGDDVVHWTVDGCAGDSSSVSSSRAVAVVGLVDVLGVPTVAGRWYGVSRPTVFIGYGAGVGAIVGVWMLLVGWLRRLPSGLADMA